MFAALTCLKRSKISLEVIYYTVSIYLSEDFKGGFVAPIGHEGVESGEAKDQGSESLVLLDLLFCFREKCSHYYLLIQILNATH
jgi:predicted transcriptional regulator with HTH domain